MIGLDMTLDTLLILRIYKINIIGLLIFLLILELKKLLTGTLRILIGGNQLLKKNIIYLD